MKVLQPKLTLGNEGKILIDTTNFKSAKPTSVSKKRKSENSQNIQPAKLTRTDGIYVDPSKTVKKKSFVDASVQTEDVSLTKNSEEKARQIKDMLTSDVPPTDYWESLANTRQKSLEAALDENVLLMEENEFLKKENKLLEEMVDEAKHLATLVQEITGDKGSGSSGEHTRPNLASTSFESSSS